MLYPIARVRVGNFKNASTFVMYSSLTGKTEVMRLQELRETKEELRGIKIQATKAKLKGKFTNLGYIGEEEVNPETNEKIECYTVIRKLLKLNKTEYVIVKKDGNVSRIEQEELISLIEKGDKVSGVQLVNKVIRCSEDIEIKVEGA